MIMNIPEENRKHIVVIGGGFAGLNFIRNLGESKYYRVTLVDKNNYNYFTPLLYQVATSFLEPSSISYPFRKLFTGKGIQFRLASVVKADTKENTLLLSNGETLQYDLLVFAAGTETNFFGNESIRQNAVFLKSIDDALFMRNEIIRLFEKAAIEKDPVEREKLLTIVIAGGGPTGVEVAGMLGEMKKYLIEKEYPELRNAPVNIHVIEGASTVLTAMSDTTHRAAAAALKRLGVQVKLNTLVTSFKDEQVHLSDGAVIHAKTLLWTAGVVARTFEGIEATSLGKGRRMITDAYNRLRGHHNIYAIGDISIQFTDRDYPNGHPQLAQPAIQQGKRLAKNLLAIAKGRQPKPFKYFDRGDMAIIGRKFAVADLFKHKVHLGGLAGLISWLFIHVISLVNYNNKIKTLYNWGVAYITSDQALRIIFQTEPKRPAS
jgi:NADH dehydrogenase